MDAIHPGIWAILVYAAVLLIGGLLGYRLSKSKASLWTGLAFAFILLSAFAYAVLGATVLSGELSLVDPRWAFLTDSESVALFCAVVVSAILSLFFALRWFHTRKVVPSGVFFLISGASLVIFLLSLQTSLKPE